MKPPLKKIRTWLRLKMPSAQSIKKQLLFTVAVLVVSVLSVYIYSIVSFIKLQQNTLMENQRIASGQMAASIASGCEKIDRIAQSVAYSQTVQKYLLEKDPIQKFDFYKDAENFLNNTKNIGDRIVDIAVIGTDGTYISIKGDIQTYLDLTDKIPEDGNNYYFGASDYYVLNSRYPSIVSGMWIYSLDPAHPQGKVGAVYVAVEPEAFLESSEMSENLIEYERLFWDRGGNLISGSETLFAQLKEQDAEKPGQHSLVLGKQRYMTLSYEIEEMSGGFATLIPYSKLNDRLSGIAVQQFLLIGAAFVVIGIVLSASLRRILIFINELTGVMDRIRVGNRKALNERIDSAGFSPEVTEVADSFNGMLDQIAKLNHDVFVSYTRMYDMEIAIKQSELHFLRSQINPHFLYNTLELICGMSAEEKNEEVIEVARALGNTLRYSIKGSDIVPFEKELEITRSYVRIQTLRFEERFSVSYEIEEKALNAQVPKIILQPLVENAVFHGLEQKLEYGHLIIRAEVKKDGERLVLSVHDDGAGMSAERLMQLRRHLQNAGQDVLQKEEDVVADSRDSIGMTNVHSRIQIYFGKESGLRVESAQNEGTHVYIEMPYKLTI